MDFTRDDLLKDLPPDADDPPLRGKLVELLSGGKLPGFPHLYAGAEAVAVGVCSQSTEIDIESSTHSAA